MVCVLIANVVSLLALSISVFLLLQLFGIRAMIGGEVDNALTTFFAGYTGSIAN